jgi:probable phosphoglycerate mutase
MALDGEAMLPRVYLIRHGETEWSAAGRHTGRTEIPLTLRGEDEARELGRRLRGISFAHVQTSPRQRATRTCQLAALGLACEMDPDLTEWDYGDYEGQRSVQIHESRPDWNLFRDGCQASVSVSDGLR